MPVNSRTRLANQKLLTAFIYILIDVPEPSSIFYKFLQTSGEVELTQEKFRTLWNMVEHREILWNIIE